MAAPYRSARADRRPVRIRAGRTVGDVLAGLGALILLAALLGGVPLALLRYAGPPLTGELLNVDLLTQRLGSETIVAILVLVVWLAWLQLALCVIVEVYAGIRRVGMPARVPFAGGTQALANRLVSAILLLFTVSAMAAPIIGSGSSAPPRPAVAATAEIGQEKTTGAQEAARPSLDVRKVKKVYVVQPPHGRHHESLWEIAEKCLGDGRRYHEIYRLNQHKEQPDGSRLRMADLIRPGWVLDMPDDAVNVHVVPENQDRPRTLDEHPGKPAEADDRTEYFEGHSEGHGDAGGVGSDERAGDARATGGGDAKAPEGSGDADGGYVGSGVREPWPDLLDYLATGSLVAAGVLAALGRRRREQLWQRAFGHRIPRPQGDAADAEVALRLGSDAPGSRMLDLGLRLLGRRLADEGRTPPTIYAAHLSEHGVDLWIHPPEADAPEPWTAHDDGRVWRLAAHEGRRVDEQALADVAAPYPGLVSLGTDGTGRLMVDLEAAYGLISIIGAHTTEALAALAVELATNRWSDGMRITLVGFGEDLTMIAPDRVRCVDTLAEVLPELEARAARPPGPDDVLTGRIASSAADPAWPPHYLLSALRPDADEARRLAVLARAGVRSAAGYVVAGAVPYATWTWEIGEDRRVRVDTLGLEATAHLLPRRHHDAVIDLFRTAWQRRGDPLPSDVPPPAGPPAIEVRILGPIEVTPVAPLEEGRADLAHEMLVYLATHPGGVHPVVLGGILWPRGVQAEVRDATIARVARWLGLDSVGRPHLYADATGRLRLGPEVQTDWQMFAALTRRARGDGPAQAKRLERALGLVRGPLLGDRPEGRYAWLAADDLEYDVTAAVADAALRLCEMRLAQGDPDAAVAAIRAGLLLAADDEGLWRALLRAVHATGDTARLRAVADALQRRAASHPYGGGMAPETEALIDDLLPTWRLHALPSHSLPSA
ncbi:bacterial transcriptional activator domain-containing protein [Thermopolyspora sp. NPDC052614]|uniref:bacterial transcriptional activator domain-containing protein n=1 Tax=Thermopolyspora sp. NPDC052614 TaxID=3155682 RepID=UPI0034138F02